MAYPETRFLPLAVKTVVVHTVTYMIMGVLAATLFNYAELFAGPKYACWFRPIDDPFVMAGVLFQPIRGVLFATVFYPLRSVLFERKSGGLIMWWLLVAVGILSTFGAAPGSIEGLVYTTLPVSIQTYPETVLQAGLLASLLFYWVSYPEKKWLSWVLGVCFAVVIILPILGLLAT
jgi:hypothetical protein